MSSPTREDLAWAAGVLDSGAQISIWQKVITLRLQRRDPRNLHRLADILEEGIVTPPTEGARTRWSFRAEGAAVLRITEKLRPWLSAERTQRVEELASRGQR
jgi:hypothetical protein